MRSNNVKSTIQSGGRALGTMIFEFDTSGVARIAAEAGAQFVLFDMEHTGWSVETIRSLLATVPASTVPLVRLPATQYHFIARVLDCGAMGVMLPMVESVEQARTIVRSAKYPPAGRRGAAFGVAHDGYNARDIHATMQSANDNVLAIAQIETRAGLENVEAIAAVEGIDVLWVGQTDLTCSLGIPGEFDHPEFLAGLDRVAAAAEANGKTAAYMALGLDEARSMLARGYRLLAYSGDIWIYQQALRSALDELQAS